VWNSCYAPKCKGKGVLLDKTKLKEMQEWTGITPLAVELINY
jgi:hypothetical protein